MTTKASMKIYRVFFNTWEVYARNIAAMSEEEAVGKACDLWEESGDLHFSVKDGGIDGVTAELLVVASDAATEPEPA